MHVAFSNAVVAILLPQSMLLSTAWAVENNAEGGKLGQCLFLNSEANGINKTQTGCSIDPLRVKENSSIRGVMKSLGLESSQVEFFGCEKTPFLTTLAPSLSGLSIRIYYPVVSAWRSEELVGPLAHELGHAVQIKIHGGMAPLMGKLNSRQIELGADFLAGTVLPTGDSGIGDYYSNSLHLVAKFRETMIDAHGTPGARASAFAFGQNIKHSLLYVVGNPAKDHETFLFDLYPTIAD